MTSNMFEPHNLMVDHGTFWRCAHGYTGWGEGWAMKPCWRCGLRHPVLFVKALLHG